MTQPLPRGINLSYRDIPFESFVLIFLFCFLKSLQKMCSGAAVWPCVLRFGLISFSFVENGSASVLKIGFLKSGITLQFTSCVCVWIVIVAIDLLGIVLFNPFWEIMEGTESFKFRSSKQQSSSEQGFSEFIDYQTSITDVTACSKSLC